MFPGYLGSCLSASVELLPGRELDLLLVRC
uniref:Uncharacterized protein n=1 Tax=Anguilla anguilla TaxID=7936 RepID=A0A0E9Q700_ANGAN